MCVCVCVCVIMNAYVFCMYISLCNNKGQELEREWGRGHEKTCRGRSDGKNVNNMRI